MNEIPVEVSNQERLWIIRGLKLLASHLHHTATGKAKGYSKETLAEIRNEADQVARLRDQITVSFDAQYLRVKTVTQRSLTEALQALRKAEKVLGHDLTPDSAVSEPAQGKNLGATPRN